MSDSVTCAGCGKRYRVKPELAGRKVRCKCGEVFAMPEAAAAGIAVDEFEVAASGPASSSGRPPASSPPPPSRDKCPQCGASLPKQAVLCVQCGYHRTTGQAMGTRTGLRVDDEELRERHAAEQERAYMVKEYYAPIAMLAIGVAVFLAGGWYLEGVTSIPIFMIATSIALAIQVAVMLLACVLTSKLLSVSFGSLGTAILKLGAIYVFPSAVSVVIGMVLGLGFVGWGVSLIIYFSLISWLFDLDLGETFIFVVIMFFVRLLLGNAIGIFVMSLFL